MGWDGTYILLTFLGSMSFPSPTKKSRVSSICFSPDFDKVMSVMLVCLPPSDQSVSPWRMRITRADMLVNREGFNVNSRFNPKLPKGYCSLSTVKGRVLLHVEVSHGTSSEPAAAISGNDGLTASNTIHVQ